MSLLSYRPELTLSQRIEYLSRAAMCAKSSTSGGGGGGGAASGGREGELLHELEEKLEVARLQLQLLDAVSKQTGALTSPAAGVEVFMDAAARLNSTLFDITEVRTPAPALTTTGACMVADVTAHRHVCHCAL